MPLPSEHFDAWEFACQCGCGFGLAPGDVSEDLIILLEDIRELVGEPLLITSGCRCPAHNAAVGGVDDSGHTRGEAGDVKTRRMYGSDRHRLLSASVRAGAQGIGIAETYTHVDRDPEKPRPAAWTY